MRKSFRIISMMIILTVALSALFGLGVASADASLLVPGVDVSAGYTVAEMTWNPNSEHNPHWVGTESQYVRVHKSNDTKYGILPGNKQNVAIIYKVPATGVLTFNSTGHMFWNNGAAGNGGIGATVLYNNKIILERQLVMGGNAIDPLKGKTLNVTAGDEIAFMVDGNGNNSGTSCVLIIDMTVAPSDGSAAINTKFQNSFSSTQGENNWYYKTYERKAAPEFEVVEVTSKTMTLEKTPLVYDEEKNLWRSGIEGNYAQFGMSQFYTSFYPAVTLTHNEAVSLTYTVSNTGHLYLSNDAHSFWSSGGNTSNGLCVTLLVNDNILLGRTYIADGKRSGDMQEFSNVLGKGVAVNAGDTLTVLVDPNGSAEYDRMFTFFGVQEVVDGNIAKSSDMRSIAPALGEGWTVERVTNVDVSDIDIKGTDETKIFPTDEEMTFTPYNRKYSKWSDVNGTQKWAFEGDNYCFMTKKPSGMQLMTGMDFSLGITYNVGVTGEMHFYTANMFTGATYQGNFTGVTILLNNKVLVKRQIIQGKSKYHFLLNKYFDVEEGDKLTFLFDCNGNNNYDSILMNIKGYILSGTEETVFNLNNEFSEYMYGDEGSDTRWEYFFYDFKEVLPEWDVSIGAVEEIEYAQFDKYLHLRDLTWRSFKKQYASNWEKDLFADHLNVCPGKDWAVSYTLTFDQAGRVMVDPASYIEMFAAKANAQDGIRYIVLRNDKDILVDWTRIYAGTEETGSQLRKNITMPVFSVNEGDTVRIIFDMNEQTGYDHCLFEFNLHFAAGEDTYTKTYSTRYDFIRDGLDPYRESNWVIDKLQISDKPDTGVRNGHEDSIFEETDDPGENGGEGGGNEGGGDELIVNKKEGCKKNAVYAIMPVLAAALAAMVVKKR